MRRYSTAELIARRPPEGVREATRLPVTILLQPRDFLSSTFLYAMLALGVLGLLVSGAPVQAASFTGWHHENAGALMPILFITGACGACSGFHCLVSSGTTSKQIANEEDAQYVAYGSMLLEGGLAVLRGTLAPAGAIVKQSAASSRLLKHRGRAVVFDGYAHL
ncbi:dihydroxy-acid dehydratase, partial [bacterium]|nr:dihydroxy-acid dehydratase [bacterium]